MIEILQTDDYEKWFRKLRDKQAKSRIQIRIKRFSMSNPGDVRRLGGKVSELRIDYGPGYRVNFILQTVRRLSCYSVGTKAPSGRTSKEPVFWSMN